MPGIRTSDFSDGGAWNATDLLGTVVTPGSGPVKKTVANLKALFGANLDSFWAPAGFIQPSATGGCAPLAIIATSANQPDLRTLDFDASTAEYAQFSVRMPKNWDRGTLTAVFVWNHGSTTTNFGVVWGIQAVAIGDDDAIAAAFGTAVTVTDTGGTTNDRYTSPATSAMTVAGSPAVGDVVNFRVYREATNGSDNLAIDARLEGVVVFYSITSLDEA